ncbi:extracellular solute-binding protein [Paenibacillus sp. LMG 31456]|uniref:Extracellular solute-binding protein n=1 Tax=Paenibacillus foliorum TaxID=2654974 RepID=A0A972JZU9_9BACL|nr:extracellular solute-binding protein [Paenibacillus foliorum]NOU93981.1 extracellular solute-binding protein [Paenibacillus foliorum]
MRFTRSWVPASVAITMAITVLGGCSTTNETSQKSKDASAKSGVNATGFPIVNEPITIQMMGSKAPLHAEWNDMLIFKEYEKKTNVKVVFEAAPDTGYKEKRNVRIASGDYPEAFYRAALTPADEVNYGSQGILIPLNDLIDKYAPNFKAIMEKHPDVKKSITAPDGNIYSLPQLNEQVAPRINKKLWINKKWLDKLGLPVPTTVDEFYKTLKAFKENDMNGNGKNDEIPWTGDKSFDLLPGLRGSWGMGTTGNRKGVYVDEDSNGKVRFFATDPKYKELLEFIARLFKEGLMDREAFAQELPQFNAKLTQGLVGAFHASNVNQAGNTYMNDYVPAPALKGPYGDQLFSNVVPFTQSQGTFAITNKNKHPEATMRWVDYFYSEEGSKFVRMGIEGVTYEKLPDGDIQYKEDIRSNPKLSLDQAAGQFSTWPGGNIPQMVLQKYDKTGNTFPSSLEAAKLLGPNTPKKVWPSFLFSKDEQDRLNSLESDIVTFVEEQQLKFIAGGQSFASWDQYVSSINKMGVKDLLKIYEAASDRYKKN